MHHTSLASMARPPIFLMRFSSSPGAVFSRSMKKRERPSEGFFTSSSAVVLARSTILVATCAEEIHLTAKFKRQRRGMRLAYIFWPDTR